MTNFKFYFLDRSYSLFASEIMVVDVDNDRVLFIPFIEEEGLILFDD
jgi:hypothetical protein